MDVEHAVGDMMTSVGDFKKGEFLAGYKKMKAPHKADALRLILLEKYGGVWIDSSLILTKPLSDILPDNAHKRQFMNLDTRVKAFHDKRIDSRGYLENWFMAFPPKDPLVTRVSKCTMEIMGKLTSEKATWEQTHMFTKQQLEFLKTSGVSPYGGTYLSMHACFFKIISEDAALWDWYFGPHTQHYDAKVAGLRLISLAKEKHPHSLTTVVREKLMHTTDDHWFRELTHDNVKMIKMIGPYRRMLFGYTKGNYLCEPSTFNKIFLSIGLHEEEFCAEWHKKVNIMVVGVVAVILVVIVGVALYAGGSKPESTAAAEPRHEEADPLYPDARMITAGRQ